MSRHDVPWMVDQSEHVAPEIDIRKPSVARIYDAILGGKDNFAWDRAVAQQALAAFPDGGKGSRLNRQALGRTVRYLTDQGIDQFLDLGSGLPTVQNTHQIAQAGNPEARVAYVDNDPVVLAHGRALLADNHSTIVVTADIRCPETILTSPEIAGFLDFGRPVGLIANAVIHHLSDDEDPYGILASYKDAVAPGSYLQVTHFSNAAPEAAALEEVLMRAIGSGKVRTRAQITSFFDGLDLVAPGVVFLPEWRPDGPVSYPLDIGGLLMLGGLGRKP